MKVLGTLSESELFENAQSTTNVVFRPNTLVRGRLITNVYRLDTHFREPPQEFVSTEAYPRVKFYGCL